LRFLLSFQLRYHKVPVSGGNIIAADQHHVFMSI